LISNLLVRAGVEPNPGPANNKATNNKGSATGKSTAGRAQRQSTLLTSALSAAFVSQGGSRIAPRTVVATSKQHTGSSTSPTASTPPVGPAAESDHAPPHAPLTMQNLQTASPQGPDQLAQIFQFLETIVTRVSTIEQRQLQGPYANPVASETDGQSRKRAQHVAFST